MVGTLLGATLTYLFQLRASQQAEASAFQRELRTERRTAYGAYSAALTEWRRGQLDWYNRRADDPGSEMTLAARAESYRLKGLAHTALSQVQLVASDQALVIAANEAFELTRPVHYAREGLTWMQEPIEPKRLWIASSCWPLPKFNPLLPSAFTIGPATVLALPTRAKPSANRFGAPKLIAEERGGGLGCRAEDGGGIADADRRGGPVGSSALSDPKHLTTLRREPVTKSNMIPGAPAQRAAAMGGR